MRIHLIKMQHSYMIILLTTLKQSESLMTRCCPPQHVFSITNCVEGDDSLLVTDSDVDLSDEDPALPSSCEPEIFHLNTNNITEDGHLVSTKYGDTIISDVCVAATEEGDVIALGCSPCSSGPCINLCCPHGEALINNVQFDPEDYSSSPFVCGVPDHHQRSQLLQHYTGLDIKDVQTNRMIQWEKDHHYSLVSPDHHFLCPPGYKESVLVPESVGDFSVLSNGSLSGSFREGNQSKLEFWPLDQYCLVIGAIPEVTDDYNYEDYYDEDYLAQDHPLRKTFMHCIPEEEISSEDSFTRTFHPVALSISVIFLILILIVYVYDDSLRGSMTGKMTLGFIINIICCYICIIDSHIKDASFDRRETISCIMTGYAILYFFHSYFFWLNAMAVHIWLSFTNMIPVNLSEKSRLILVLIYTQALPLTLCIITAIIDAYPVNNADLQYYPEMGVYNCYLGSQYRGDTVSYFSTPIFIYQQSILLITMIINTLLLVHVGVRYCSTNTSQGEKRRELTSQVITFIRIFFILGFTWICELISTALHTEHKENTFYARLALDIINLFLVNVQIILSDLIS